MKQAPPDPAPAAWTPPRVPAPSGVGYPNPALPGGLVPAAANARPVRGFPGGIGDLGSVDGPEQGPGVDEPADHAAAHGPEREAVPDAAGPASSVWERSWLIWSHAGIAWQRPADWAQDSIDRHTEPIPVVTAPATPERAARRRPGRRTAILAVIVGLAVLAAAGAGTEVSRQVTAAPRTSLALVTPFGPARFTGTVFRAPPGVSLSALPPSLTTVAAAGETVIAAGSTAATGVLAAARPPGLPARLPLIMVSTDGGHTWKRAAVHAIPDAGSGSVPVMAAGGQGRWLALGRHYAWVSADGMTWRETAGVSPLAGGDQVQSLVRTAGGFLAAGVDVTGQGRRLRYRPVIWQSADGLTWHRRSGAKTGLPSGGGSVLALRWAASHRDTILLGGEVAGAGAGSQGTTGAGTREARAWRSTDGGLTWGRVSVPVSHRALRRFSGIVASGAAFVAVRPGRSAAGRPDAVSYVSRDGLNWRFGSTITAAQHSALRVTAVAGSADGVALGSVAGQRPAAFVSPQGYVWQRAASLDGAASARLTGLAAAPGGRVIAAVVTPDGQPSLLLLAGSHAGTVGHNALVQAAANVMVNGIAQGGREQAAAGSADGMPAIWWRRGNGTWQSASLLPPAGAGRTGAGQQPQPSGQPRAGSLTGVAYGRGGWLAVGSSAGTGLGRPLVMTSHDGRAWHVQPGVTQFAAPGTVVTVTDVAAQRSGFVAVGSADGHPAVWTGPVGRHWQLTTLPPPAGVANATLTSVAVHGKRLAAFGTASTQAGPKPFQAVSLDGGRHWRESALPVPGGLARVTTASTVDGGFIVTGAANTAGRHRILVWWSPDGLAWHVAAIPRGQGAGAISGPGAISALVASRGSLTGFGYALTSSAAQRPIVWHARLRQATP